jgi:hypothetical protein
MIGVNALWETIAALTSKDQAGYTSTAEFNYYLTLAEHSLQSYFMGLVEESSNQHDALLPFSLKTTLSKNGSGYELPSNFRKRIDAGPVYITQGDEDCATVTVSEKNADYMSGNELAMNESSPIRKSTTNRFTYEILGGWLYMFPSSYAGDVWLKYYRYPTLGSRAFVLNTSTHEEVYDAGSSVDLEWPAFLYTDFVDLLLAYKGLSIRENVIVNWVQQNKSTGMEPESNRSYSNRRF